MLLYYDNYIDIHCVIWLQNMYAYIKGGMQAKGTWKQDPEANIWDWERSESGVEKVPQWVSTVHLI